MRLHGMHLVGMAVLAACLAAIPSFAQSIDGPASVAAGQPAWFTVTGLSESASVSFIPSDQIDTDPAHVKEGSALFWAPMPGTYKIAAMVVDWDARSLVPITKTVVVGGGDDENPIPPIPPDDETIPPGERLVLIISESSMRTPGEASVIQGCRQEMEAKQIPYRIMDPDAEADWLQPYLAEMRSRGVAPPALMVIVLSQGEDYFVSVDSLPGRYQEAYALIQEGLNK